MDRPWDCYINGSVSLLVKIARGTGVGAVLVILFYPVLLNASPPHQER